MLARGIAQCGGQVSFAEANQTQENNVGFLFDKTRRSLRWRERFCERAWLTMVECAYELNVNVGVIRTMVKHRLLAARQRAKGAPWMIQRDDLYRAEVQHYTKAAHTGKPAPRREDTKQ